jgi:hypothetical protein
MYDPSGKFFYPIPMAKGETISIAQKGGQMGMPDIR